MAPVACLQKPDLQASQGYEGKDVSVYLHMRETIAFATADATQHVVSEEPALARTQLSTPRLNCALHRSSCWHRRRWCNRWRRREENVACRRTWRRRRNTTCRNTGGGGRDFPLRRWWRKLPMGFFPRRQGNVLIVAVQTCCNRPSFTVAYRTWLRARFVFLLFFLLLLLQRRRRHMCRFARHGMFFIVVRPLH